MADPTIFDILNYLQSQGGFDVFFVNAEGPEFSAPTENSFIPPDRQDRKVRVRELTDYLLEDLTNEKKSLPPKMFTEKYDATPYPYSVTKSRSYSDFGLCMEDFILYTLFSLYSLTSQPEKFSSKRFRDCQNFTADPRNFFGCVSDPDYKKYSLSFETAKREIVLYFGKNYPISKIEKIECDGEISHGEIIGHPDLAVFLPQKEVVIFDVKVFARMTGGNTNREIRAQLAMYIALYRKNGYTCNTVGIIMPWNRDPIVMTYDVSKWKSQDLFEIATTSAGCVKREPQVRIKWQHLLQTYDVGSHVLKETAFHILNTRSSYTTPFQLFLYGNNPSAKSEIEGRKIYEKLNPDFRPFKAFVHAPYNLNLAKRDSYIATAAKNYMLDGAKYGFRGVVFHCGHHPDSKEGVRNMKKNIRKILEVTTEECPFLLETPCGNANELLSTPQEFGRFLSKFPSNKIGGCLDTAHVFVSGFMPMEYLSLLCRDGRDKIAFFHFNGSRRRHCCHVDGHAHVTKVQNIPDEELVQILDYAKEWSVCCVTE
jgi:endonuclease IV